ncbi:MAG: sigma-G inhibitor, Gin [Peptococcaceae bacterium]|nr:sigma-G inhibitor, Gin [Peptococcaceae bacterium]
MLCRSLRQKNNQGLLVKGNYICPECEARIIALTREDPDYDYYKWGLKKIWYCPGA